MCGALSPGLTGGALGPLGKAPYILPAPQHSIITPSLPPSLLRVLLVSGPRRGMQERCACPFVASGSWGQP